MPNPSSGSSSQSGPTNGGLDVEPETDQPNYPPRNFKLEDFSQQRINRGQQEINYLIVETNEKIVQALNELKLVVARLGGSGHEWSALDNAVKEVADATRRIAGRFPPGCVKPEGEE